MHRGSGLRLMGLGGLGLLCGLLPLLAGSAAAAGVAIDARVRRADEGWRAIVGEAADGQEAQELAAETYGSRRSYSMANAPHNGPGLELHIRHMPGGVFTDMVFGVAAQPLKVRDILRFEGPLGTFFLREDSDKPMIWVTLTPHLDEHGRPFRR